MSFSSFVCIYQISIYSDSNLDLFETAMKSEVFPRVGVGKPTRGGFVKAQSLLKGESSSSAHHYFWVVHWNNQGGSPFGSRNAPPDPAPHLTAFEAKTSFTRYTVQAEET